MPCGALPVTSASAAAARRDPGGRRGCHPSWVMLTAEGPGPLLLSLDWKWAVSMTTPFRGLVNMDVRESVPDWAPYGQTKAPSGAPNVVYIVLDDVGFAGLSCYGGMIDTPNIDKIAARGVRYNEWHTTALCSPTRSCLLTGRNHTTNGIACITQGPAGLPDSHRHTPPDGP